MTRQLVKVEIFSQFHRWTFFICSPNKTEFIKAKYQMLAYVHRMPCRDDDSVTAKDLSKVKKLFLILFYFFMSSTGIKIQHICVGNNGTQMTDDNGIKMFLCFCRVKEVYFFFCHPHWVYVNQFSLCENCILLRSFYRSINCSQFC